MKIVNVCESSLLATEVYSMLKNDPRNALAFTERDPLENPDITNPDHLRRLVATRRMCNYIETVLHTESISSDPIFPHAVAALRSHGLSNDVIARLVDSLAVAGTPEGSLIYCPLILGESDNDKIKEILCVLGDNKRDLNERIAVLAECSGGGPSAKRRPGTFSKK